MECPIQLWPNFPCVHLTSASTGTCYITKVHTHTQNTSDNAYLVSHDASVYTTSQSLLFVLRSTVKNVFPVYSDWMTMKIIRYTIHSPLNHCEDGRPKKIHSLWIPTTQTERRTTNTYTKLQLTPRV